MRWPPPDQRSENDPKLSVAHQWGTNEWKIRDQAGIANEWVDDVNELVLKKDDKMLNKITKRRSNGY